MAGKGYIAGMPSLNTCPDIKGIKTPDAIKDQLEDLQFEHMP